MIESWATHRSPIEAEAGRYAYILILTNRYDQKLIIGDIATAGPVPAAITRFDSLPIVPKLTLAYPPP